MKCPNCGVELESNVFHKKTEESTTILLGTQLHFTGGAGLEINVKESATTTNMILKALTSYWRAKVEQDYVHDSYRNYIGFLGNSTYDFHVRTYDSPGEETWIHGKIKVMGPSSIEIIEQGIDDGVYWDGLNLR